MSALSTMNDLFAKRFEPDGDGYIFRHRLTEPGYRVSAGERDRFVADFDRQATRVLWGVGALMAVALAGVAWWSVVSGEVSSLAIFLTIAGCVLANVVATHRLWAAPLRALQDRRPVVEGMSKADARRAAFRQMSWGHFAVGPGIAAAVAWRGYSLDPELAGEGRWWLAGAGLMLGLFAVQAFRKWRSDRRG